MTISERLKPFLENVKPGNRYSQSGEDFILQDIFNRLGTANKVVLECGAGDGIWFSNSRKLIEEGWSAVLIEGEEKAYERLSALYAEGQPHADRVKTFHRIVAPHGPDSFDAILTEAGAPTDIDLAVIDIDGADYHVWNNLLKHRPRVVVIEFNPTAEDPAYIPPIGAEGQAGFEAIKLLGIGKRYYPVCQTYCNLIFVQQELIHLLTDDPEPVSNQEMKDQLPAKIACAMSTGRLGFMHTVDCVYNALAAYGIPLSRGEGAWWHHGLSRSIQIGIDRGAEYILSIDHDTLFTTQDVARLVIALQDNEDIDVAVPLQQKREGGELLASAKGEVNLLAPFNPINQGHFGLTLFRRSVFERISKPWLIEIPNEHGEWGENRIDPDINFWKNCESHGINTVMAMDVVVGHLELVCSWPHITPENMEFRPYYQTLSNWRKNGQVKPPEAFDRAKVKEWAEAGLIQGAKVERLELKD